MSRQQAKDPRIMTMGNGIPNTSGGSGGYAWHNQWGTLTSGAQQRHKHPIPADGSGQAHNNIRKG